PMFSPKICTRWFLPAVLAVFLIGTAWAQEKQEEKAEKEKPKEPGVVRISEIVVSATRLADDLFDLSRVPAQSRVVTEKEIKELGARDVPEAIQYEPGITLYQNVGNGFEPILDMRGFNGQPVTTTTVIMDGVRVNNPDFNTVDWDLIPIYDLERIEVVPGTAPVFGKGALAGVVNLQTKRGGPVPEANVEVTGGSFGRLRFRGNIGGPVGDFDYYLGFTQELEDGFRDASDADVKRLFTKVGRRFGTKADITLSYLFADDHIEQAGTIPEDILPSLSGCSLRIDRKANCTPGDLVERTLHAPTINMRYRLPAGFSLGLDAFFRDLDQETVNFGVASESESSNDTTTGGVTFQMSNEATPLDRRNVFVVGVEYTRSGFDSQGSAEFTGFPPSFNNTQTDEDVVGIYFQESFDVIPEALILSVGGRYDWDRIDFSDRLDPTQDRVRTFQRFNPRAGVTWNPTPDVGAYFSYSEGFRTPTVNELFTFFPFSSNPDLDPAVSRTFEFGGRAYVGEYFEGTLALFRTDVDDEILFIVTDPTTGGGQNQNVGQTRRRGIELTLKGRYRELLDGFLNYSYIKATFENDILLSSGLVTSGNDIPLVPRNRLGVGVNVYPVEGLTFSLAGVYVDEQFLSGDEPNQARQLDSYFVLNGQVSYRRGPITIFLQGKNITDTEYEPWGVLAFGGDRFLMPAPGAHFLAGVNLNFSGFY
ncbi:MAG: TonB-dependent receptor, partial [Nitrospiraceae bacterium]